MGNTNSKPYQKLPGTHKGFIVGKYTLWKGSDHLLQVYARMGVEDYKRFYYKDIQALVVQKTSTGLGLTIVSGAAFALLAIIAAVTGGAWAIFYGILAGVLLMVFLYFFIKGATCQTYLLTAVQTEKIKSLGRLSTALRVVDQLRPIVTAAQGSVQPEHLNRQPVRAPEAPQTADGVSPKPASVKKNKKHESGRAHFVLFCMLIVYALLVVLDLVFSHAAVAIASTIGVLGLMICALAALIRQQDSNISRSLQGLTWMSLGYVGLVFMVGYIVSLVYSFRNPQPIPNQWQMYKMVADISPWESPFLLSFSVFTLCSAFLMGLTGLIWLRRHQRVCEPSDHAAAADTSKPLATRRSEP